MFTTHILKLLDFSVFAFLVGANFLSPLRLNLNNAFNSLVASEK